MQWNREHNHFVYNSKCWVLLAVSKTDTMVQFKIYIFIPLSHQLECLACAKFNTLPKKNVLSSPCGDSQATKHILDQIYGNIYIIIHYCYWHWNILDCCWHCCCCCCCVEFCIRKSFWGSFTEWDFVNAKTVVMTVINKIIVLLRMSRWS